MATLSNDTKQSMSKLLYTDTFLAHFTWESRQQQHTLHRRAALSSELKNENVTLHIQC